jgi:hypothetical protein
VRPGTGKLFFHVSSSLVPQVVTRSIRSRYFRKRRNSSS